MSDAIQKAVHMGRMAEACNLVTHSLGKLSDRFIDLGMKEQAIETGALLLAFRGLLVKAKIPMDGGGS